MQGVGCKPDARPNDPVGLVWDENPESGFAEVQKLARVSDAARVLFWNTAWSHFDDGNVIENNIQALVNSNARPDVVIFCEFKKDAMKADFMDFMFREYPNYAYVPYTPTSDVGIAVYSTFPFVQQGPERLEWAPANQDDAGRAAYRAAWDSAAHSESQYWDRPYARFRFDAGDKVFNLVPVHLLEPWAAFKTRYGSLGVLKNFYLGGDNPVVNQYRELRRLLRRDLGEDMNDEPLLLIGDFNVPKGKNAPYKGLSRGFDEAFDTLIGDGAPFTFPSMAAPERQQSPFNINPVKIDHAFLSRQLRSPRAGVLPLRGSDHYPIYVTIQQEQ